MSDTAPASPDASASQPTPPETDATDWKAEAEKWKALSKKNESQAKANLKEAETLRQASMSDVEKAAAIARQEGESSALQRIGARLVDAEVRVAAAGRNVDVEALLEGLDRTRFVGDDGEPNSKAIAAWVERIAPASSTPATPAPLDLGQGARSNSSLALNGDPLLNAVKSKLGIPGR